ncbi:acetate--CoA ligase family protein [Candidatus Hodarchaeum mangrovi]
MNKDLTPFFDPKAMALIGASDQLPSWGFRVAHNIIINNYTGEFFPISLKKSEILGFKAYPTILDIPNEKKIDLAIIIIPAIHILGILEQCKIRGVNHVVIISGGFKESGKTGLELEKKILAFSRANNIRIIGPNGMGIVSTRVHLYAVMWPTEGLKHGGLTFVSQSGNIGTIGISVASKRGIGLNVYVSAGNMADLSMSDFLEYFGKYDSKTKVIGFYMEGIEDARHFVKLAREISKTKPIIILKAGGSKAGRLAANSHTGAITGDDLVFKQIMESAGAILVESLEEMFDLFLGFSRWIDWNFPRGKVVVLTLGGGWGVMTADSCSKHGITLEPLSDALFDRINAILPPFWSKGNPIDTVASVDLNSLKEIIVAILEEMVNIEAIFLLGIGGFSFVANLAKKSPIIPDDQKGNFDMVIAGEISLFQEIISISQKFKKPILITTLLTSEDSPAVQYLNSRNYPIFTSPEKMVRVFRYMVNYYKWCNRL